MQLMNRNKNFKELPRPKQLSTLTTYHLVTYHLVMWWKFAIIVENMLDENAIYIWENRFR